MNKALKAILWGLIIALYFRFGLEATGWFFYEASFALHIDALYLGYQGFRGIGYLLNQFGQLGILSTVLGLIVALLVYWRLSHKENKS